MQSEIWVSTTLSKNKLNQKSERCGNCFIEKGQVINYPFDLWNKHVSYQRGYDPINTLRISC